MQPRSLTEVIYRLPHRQAQLLPKPNYVGPLPGHTNKVALAVQSMRHHMTDEGWQIMLALRSQWYTLCGYDDKDDPILHIDMTDVRDILKLTQPRVVVVQDKREWEGLTADRSRDPAMRFRYVEALRDRSDIFKVSILKDAHHDLRYNRDSAEEIGCHAWIIYYHPKVIKHLAPYVRGEHLIRTYHSLDPVLVPNYKPDRPKACILSGAISSAYPVRQLLVNNLDSFPEITHLRHPGYNRRGCLTPAYLIGLSNYRVAICTSSIYGYALRKIMEATACGCRVITDLPADDILPMIDDNLVRFNPDSPKLLPILKELIRREVENYDPERQEQLAWAAKQYYDYRNLGRLLDRQIEDLIKCY